MSANLVILYLLCYLHASKELTFVIKAASEFATGCILQQSFAWMNQSCLNNLNDLYKHYYKGAKPLDKHLRDVFVTGTVDDVIQNFQVHSLSLLTMCIIQLIPLCLCVIHL